MTKEQFKDGILYKQGNTRFLFTNRFFNETSNSYFDPADLQTCEQIHSNIITKVINNKTPKCDGIYSQKVKNIVLKIRTADCLPILASNDNSLFAIHAGWKGLSSNIIGQLTSFQFTNDDKVIIGPHIKTYEVGDEVIEHILLENKNLGSYKDQFVNPKKNGKYLLNLGQLASLQLIDIGFQKNQIIISETNTLLNNDWHSYRRDSQNAGRNYSYIYLQG